MEFVIIGFIYGWVLLGVCSNRSCKIRIIIKGMVDVDRSREGS